MADIRVKLGKRKEDLESIPSEISMDEWAEITKYQQERDNEQKRKEREEHKKKKQQIKSVLDKQL